MIWILSIMIYQQSILSHWADPGGREWPITSLVTLVSTDVTWQPSNWQTSNGWLFYSVCCVMRGFLVYFGKCLKKILMNMPLLCCLNPHFIVDPNNTETTHPDSKYWGSNQIRALTTGSAPWVCRKKNTQEVLPTQGQGVTSVIVLSPSSISTSVGRIVWLVR